MLAFCYHWFTEHIAMSALVIKNLPEALHHRLKARARRNHRSLTREAIAILEAGVNQTENVATSHTNALDALAAAGQALIEQGVDLKTWSRQSRNVWR